MAYGDQTQLVQTGGVAPALESLLGQGVVVRGKLVGTRDDAPIAPGSELWSATIATFAAQPVDCYLEGDIAQVEVKLSPHLKRLLEERPGEQLEPVSIGFCDNLEITPYFSVQELTKLRAPLYRKLEEELEPHILTVLEGSSWLQSMSVEMKLQHVLEVDARHDVASLASLNETAPPP